MMHRLMPKQNHPASPLGRRRLTKLLISVTVQGRVGSVQMIMSSENTVGHVIKAVLEVYQKERRRPLLSQNNNNHPSCFELHYSPFSMQSLNQEEELINLGSRNFFLCQKPVNECYAGTCTDQSKNFDKFPFLWAKLTELLL